MILGHYGIALAAKRWAPQSSLGSLVLAAQLADEVWPLLLLLGIEKVQIEPSSPPTLRLHFIAYPISHSLLTALAGGVLFGVIYYLFRKDFRGSIVTTLLVPSHWLLDSLVHIPDLPVWPGGPRVGLGLWRSLPLTLLLEAGFFLFGLFVYLESTSAKNTVGRYAIWGFVVLLVGAYASSLLGPPPKDVHSLAWSTLALWIFVPLASWTDAQRLTVVLPA